MTSRTSAGTTTRTAGVGCLASAAANPPSADSSLNCFPDEERVAVRLLPDRVDELLARGRGRCGTDVLPHRRAVEPTERQRSGDRIAFQRGERHGKLVALTEIDVPNCGDRHHHWHITELRRKELQKQDGRDVGILQVVQDEQERLAGGKLAEERDDRVEQLEAG